MRFSLGSTDVLTRVVAALSNGREKEDALLDRLMKSGVMDPVKDDPPPTAQASSEGGAMAPGQSVVRPQ